MLPAVAPAAGRVFAGGFRAAMTVSAVLLVAGAVISVATVRNDALRIRTAG